MRESLIEAVPDLVAFVSRDGTILDHLGGRRLGSPGAAGALTGSRLEAVWSESLAKLARQMIRGVFATREAAEAQFREGQHTLEIRVRPHDRRRALLLIRDVANAQPAGLRTGADARAVELRRTERRGFLKRFLLSIADASLREQPLAVCMIHLGGVDAISQALGFSVAEKVCTLALERLQGSVGIADNEPDWHVGQLGEGLLCAVVSGFRDPASLHSLVSDWCRALGEELRLGDASFTLTPHAGVAFLGQDASRPQVLLEHSRAAMLEARRAATSDVRFYSETMRLRPLAGLDAERELREAVEAGEFRLAYAARHDLQSGTLVALHVDLRWLHPRRGELRGSQFLPLAGHTGLVPVLGRWAFQRLGADLPGLAAAVGPDVLFSVAIPRQHLAGGTLEEDLAGLLGGSGLPAASVELRLAERTVTGLLEPRRQLESLANLGVGLVVDDFGRAFSSLARLAELPLKGLQLDRRIVAQLGDDDRALGVCEAAIGVARAFGLSSSAAGVDSKSQQALLQGAGCNEGLGACFGEIVPAPAAESRFTQLP